MDPRWAFHNAAVVGSFAIADIEIYDVTNDATSYNSATNSWTTSDTILWQGKARLQPKINNNAGGRSGSEVVTYDPGVRQIIEVHIGLRENQLLGSDGVMPDLRPGFKMRVTASPLDAQLVNYDYTIRSVVNSSNPWSRMLLCEINQELNPNG